MYPRAHPLFPARLKIPRARVRASHVAGVGVHHNARSRRRRRRRDDLVLLLVAPTQMHT